MGSRLRGFRHCACLLLSQLILDVVCTNKVGKKFLKENKNRPGVITLASGLQYKVLKKGSGKYHPSKAATCTCHYAGTTPSLTPDAIDKPEAEWNDFDSSYKSGEPAEFAPNEVIKGWTQAMQLMVEGDKWEMYVPSELGYGADGSGNNIKSGDLLIFRMELLKIKGKKLKKQLFCSPKAKDDCDAEQLKLIDEWMEKSDEDIDKKIKALKNKMKYENKLKARNQMQVTINILNEVTNAKKPGKEL